MIKKVSTLWANTVSTLRIDTTLCQLTTWLFHAYLCLSMLNTPDLIWHSVNSWSWHRPQHSNTPYLNWGIFFIWIKSRVSWLQCRGETLWFQHTVMNVIMFYFAYPDLLGMSSSSVTAPSLIKSVKKGKGSTYFILDDFLSSLSFG